MTIEVTLLRAGVLCAAAAAGVWAARGNWILIWVFVAVGAFRRMTRRADDGS